MKSRRRTRSYYEKRDHIAWVILNRPEAMTVKRAYDIGYVQSVVPDRAAPIVEVKRIAKEGKTCTPLSAKPVKRVMRYELDLPLPPQGQMALDIVQGLTAEEREVVGKSEDRAEGPKAFTEKRTPQWKMR